MENKIKNISQESDSEALEGAIRLIEKAKHEGFSFSAFLFHGAETTTLQASTVAEISSRVHSFAPEAKLGIQTNGTLITEEYLEKLLDFKDLLPISISLDGPPEIHDKMRGKTFSTIWNNALNARSMGFQVSFLITVSAASIENLHIFSPWIQSLITDKMKFRLRTVHGENSPLTDDQQIKYATWIYKNRLARFEQSMIKKLCQNKGNECDWIEIDPWGGSYGCNLTYSENQKLANWHEEPMVNILAKRVEKFSQYRTNLECESCKYKAMCNSGCPAIRVDGLAYNCLIKKTIFELFEEDNEDISSFWERQKKWNR